MNPARWLVGLAALAFASVAAAQDPWATRPRLVVLCSVDQLARWVFEQARPHLFADGGFRRILRDGVEFSRCAYQHACTETGPGHATIGTGAPAALHGIVRNTWFDPGTGKLGYCVAQPQAEVPGLPEGKDRGPGQLLVPTLGDLLKACVPGAKVASVSWKDRAAILMAGRSADCVAWFETTTGNLVTNSQWCREAPAWLLAFDKTRAIDGFFGWRWERCAGDAAYTGLVDDRAWEGPHGNGLGQRTLPQTVTGGKDQPGAAFYAQVYVSPIANTLVRQAAEAAVDGLQLGADDAGDLLCVSFSATDLVGHRFGADSVEARDTLLRLDRELAQFLTFLDERVGKDRYALFLTADHGVGPSPEAAKAAGLDAGRGPIEIRVRAAAEKALADRFGAPPEGKRYLQHVGEFTAFLDRDVLRATAGQLDEATRLREAARTVAAAAVKVPGMAAAYATDDLLERQAGVDPVRDSLVLALAENRAGDVQLVLKPFWLDGASAASHGTPHAYDREVVGLAMGPDLARGLRCPAPITPGFGAVLFAELLGIPRPTAAVDQVPDGVRVAR